MRFSVILSALILAAGTVSLGNISAQANELDNEGSVINVDQRAAASQLPATVVVRVSSADQSVAVMQSTQPLPAQQVALADASFTSMPLTGNMTGPAELDHDSSTDSWFFWFNNFNWYYPTYYYQGYTYNYYPYFNYFYGGYNYYYFRWFR